MMFTRKSFVEISVMMLLLLMMMMMIMIVMMMMMLLLLMLMMMMIKIMPVTIMNKACNHLVKCPPHVFSCIPSSKAI